MILKQQISKIQNCFEIKTYLVQVLVNEEVIHLELEEIVNGTQVVGYTGKIPQLMMVPPGIPVLDQVRVTLKDAKSKEEAIEKYLEILTEIKNQSTNEEPKIIVPTAEESHKLRLV